MTLDFGFRNFDSDSVVKFIVENCKPEYECRHHLDTFVRLINNFESGYPPFDPEDDNQKSYDHINEIIMNKLQLFMSLTLEEVKSWEFYSYFRYRINDRKHINEIWVKMFHPRRGN